MPTVLHQGADADGSWLVTAAVPAARPSIRGGSPGPRPPRPRSDAGSARSTIACPSPSARSTGRSSDGWTHASTDLGAAPPIDRLVVCHGDACAPNTLLLDDGTVAAHVDLGALGVADRWADLAVAAWSTEWNYGPGYDGLVYVGYGVAPDAERIAYYRGLWDAE